MNKTIYYALSGMVVFFVGYGVYHTFLKYESGLPSNTNNLGCWPETNNKIIKVDNQEPKANLNFEECATRCSENTTCKGITWDENQSNPNLKCIFNKYSISQLNACTDDDGDDPCIEDKKNFITFDKYFVD